MSNIEHLESFVDIAEVEVRELTADEISFVTGGASPQLGGGKTFLPVLAEPISG